MELFEFCSFQTQDQLLRNSPMKIWDFGTLSDLDTGSRTRTSHPQGTTATQWSIAVTILYTGRLPSRFCVRLPLPSVCPQLSYFPVKLLMSFTRTKNRIYCWSLISTIWFRLSMFNAGSQCWQLIHFPNSYIIKSVIFITPTDNNDR